MCLSHSKYHLFHNVNNNIGLLTKILVEALGWCLISSFWFLEIPVSVIFLIMESPTKFLRLFSWKLFDIVFFCKVIIISIIIFYRYFICSCGLLVTILFVYFIFFVFLGFIPATFLFHSILMECLARLFQNETGTIVPKYHWQDCSKWDWLDFSQVRLAWLFPIETGTRLVRLFPRWFWFFSLYFVF